MLLSNKNTILLLNYIMSKQDLIDLLKDGDNDPPCYELENILTQSEQHQYEEIKANVLRQRIESLNISDLRFLVAIIIPHIGDNKYFVEYGLINNDNDENLAFETMMDKFTETEIQKKIKLYKKHKAHTSW